MGLTGFGLLDSSGKQIKPKFKSETQNNIIISRFLLFKIFTKSLKFFSFF